MCDKLKRQTQRGDNRIDAAISLVAYKEGKETSHSNTGH